MIQIMDSTKYIVVSGACFALNVLFTLLFAIVGLHFALAALIAFFLVAAVGFTLHCMWTFRENTSAIGFFRYIYAMSMNLPLNTGLLFIWHEFLGFSLFVSTITSSLILAFWNFFAVRWAVRRKKLLRAL